jgi:hypothetical protein
MLEQGQSRRAALTHQVHHFQEFQVECNPITMARQRSTRPSIQHASTHLAMQDIASEWVDVARHLLNLAIVMSLTSPALLFVFRRLLHLKANPVQ